MKKLFFTWLLFGGTIFMIWYSHMQKINEYNQITAYLAVASGTVSPALPQETPVTEMPRGESVMMTSEYLDPQLEQPVNSSNDYFESATADAVPAEQAELLLVLESTTKEAEKVLEAYKEQVNLNFSLKGQHATNPLATIDITTPEEEIGYSEEASMYELPEPTRRITGELMLETASFPSNSLAVKTNKPVDINTASITISNIDLAATAPILDEGTGEEAIADPIQEVRVNEVEPEFASIESTPENAHIVPVTYKEGSTTTLASLLRNMSNNDYSYAEVFEKAEQLKGIAEKNGYNTSFAVLINAGATGNKRFFVVNLQFMTIERAGYITDKAKADHTRTSALNREKELKDLGIYRVGKKETVKGSPAYNVSSFKNNQHNLDITAVLLKNDVSKNGKGNIAAMQDFSPEFLNELGKITGNQSKPVLMWVYDNVSLAKQSIALY